MNIITKINASINEDQELPNLISLIKRDCNSFLSQSKQSLIYRGIKSHKEPLFKGNVRKNRKPESTPKDTQVKIDDIFFQKFGWRARSEGLLTSGNPKQAIGYGRVYAIFPIGDFKFIYSNTISDLYLKTAEEPNPFLVFFDEIKSLAAKDPMEFMTNAAMIRNIKKQLSSYSDIDLHKAIQSNSEIMIECDSYYAIDTNVYSPHDIHELLYT